MKTQFLLVAAIALGSVSATADAAPNALQQFVDKAHAQADQRLADAHVTLTGQPVAVRATVGGDGRLNGVHVIRSSGSRDTDFAVEQALKKMTVGEAPNALIAATIDLTFGQAPIVQAKAP